MTYRGSANGDEPPIRVIAGPHTQITNGDRLALDPVHNEVYLPMDDKILVFPADGDGDLTPTRIIEGLDTLLGADSMTVDPVNNLLIVGGNAPTSAGGPQSVAEARSGARGQVLIFNRTDSGNAKPRAIIRGPKTQIRGTARVVVYPPTKYFLVGVNASSVPSPGSFVGVWSENDSGDVAPRWTIGGPNQILRQVRGITLVPKAKNVIVTDKYVNAVMTFYLPEIF